MTKPPVELDQKDLKILAELRRDAKATTNQISRRTAIPVTTVHNRIKRFEKLGIVKGYVPVLDHGKLGAGLHALIFVTVDSKLAGNKAVDQEEIARHALRIPGIEHARIITGGYDLVLEARVADVEALNQLLIKELRKLPGVDKTQTMLVLEEFEKKA